jgi:glycerol-3-phosphate dehydrogenase
MSPRGKPDPEEPRRVHLQAEARFGGIVYQAAGDQHVHLPDHYQGGIRRPQRFGFVGVVVDESTYPRIGPAERAAALAAMAAAEHDVVVIGGGVMGAGIALDAVSRGLSVALIEARDFGFGTSSRSSRLVDGGYAELEKRNFGVVRNSLIERSLLLRRIAPHLVHPVQFLLPQSHYVWGRASAGAIFAAYDQLGFALDSARGLPRHQQVTKRQALDLTPALKPSGLTGGLVYWEAGVDDARFVTCLVRTAASFGAQVASRTQATGFLREGERVTGVRATDLETGYELELRAKAVINATGAWTDEIQEMVGGRPMYDVHASKGVHLVIPKDRIHSRSGLIFRTPVGFLTVIPWGRHWIIGTTDTEWSLSKAFPAASRIDIDYLLGQVNRVLARPLTSDDVEGVYAGLRPIPVRAEDPYSEPLGRHRMTFQVPGLLMVAGGRFATYRRIAQEAVDAVAKDIRQVIPPSCTDEVSLAGADGYRPMWNARDALARSSGVHASRIEHLLHRYGTLTGDILGLIDRDPDLGKPLAGADDYLRAEVVYSVTHEGARHLDDVLTRRTHITVETWDRGVSAAEEAVQLMAGPMKWRSRQIARELENYRATVAAERASQEASTDQDADAIRLGAPDIVPVLAGDTASY